MMNKKHSQTKIKYGTFDIEDDIAHWRGDAGVQIPMQESISKACELEGFWNPHHAPLKDEYETAMTGLCIWGKYDCLFKFKPRGKGNPGAERSLASPKDMADVLKRLHSGHHVEKIMVSPNPFGVYQTRLINWQADLISHFDVKKLYYALPIEEYQQTLQQVADYFPQDIIQQVMAILNEHHQQLETKITQEISADIDFIHPLQIDKSLSTEESYVWPYKNLKVDLGLEEMEEIQIAYQAMKEGVTLPPILLGMLGSPCPYYERRTNIEPIVLTLP